MVALQGCKSTTDMNKLTKTAKESNAKIAKDKKALTDFETPIKTFEKEVKKVTEQKSTLKADDKEYKDLKVTDVCANLKAMETQFKGQLSAADAKTLFDRYTKGVASKWKFFEYIKICTGWRKKYTGLKIVKWL